MEGEKNLYDLSEKQVYHGVMRLVDTVSDYTSDFGEDIVHRVTNEFVVNMVEINSLPSTSILDVVKNYLLYHSVVTDLASRENTVMLPLASIPFDFEPLVIPKFDYYVQNCILSGSRLRKWKLSKNSPMVNAANCCGIHVHGEIETSKEFLVFSRELVDKHNLALMLTPMIAFSASPYFYKEHSAHSMRAKKYYYGVYEKFPMNGGLPPVLESSYDVLKYHLGAVETWIQEGERIGFDTLDLQKMTAKKGASWGFLRWNSKWNTVELRCLESDRVDLDVGKFVIVAGAMKRSDLAGEALICQTLSSTSPLDLKMIEECFEVNGKVVSILPTHAINDLCNRAVEKGLQDELVEAYLQKLFKFADAGIPEDAKWLVDPLKKCLDTKQTTADLVLQMNNHLPTIEDSVCHDVIKQLIDNERVAIKAIRQRLPETSVRQKQMYRFPKMPKDRV